MSVLRTEMLLRRLFLLLLYCGGIWDAYATSFGNQNVWSEKPLPLVAHRGCWSGDSLPQNSLAAFRKALQQDIYGTEFDVHQTADGKLVVNHDATFNGLAIAQTTYADLCRTTLPNGETIPLLEQFVRAYCEMHSSVLMVVELKTCSVDAVVNMLQQYNVLSHAIFISFSRKYCLQLVDKGLGPVTYYLNADLTPQEIKDLGIGGIDYHFSHFQSHPTWIPESQDLGVKLGVWTVNDPAMIRDFLDKSVVVTTDNVFL